MDDDTTNQLGHLAATIPFAAALGIEVNEVTAQRVTATPLHVGRTTIVAQTNLTDDRGKLVAQVTQTQAVLPQ
jgi:acyl-coenzyme A thioesterase PaaI-like protein